MALDLRFGNRQGIRSVPVYPMVNWRRGRSDGNVVVYRPGIRTLLTRLMWTFAMAVIIAIMAYEYLGPNLSSAQTTLRTTESGHPKESLKRVSAMDVEPKGMPTEEQRREIEKDRAQRQAKRDETRNRMATVDGLEREGIIAIMILLALVGIIMPLSCLWSFLVVRMTPRGELEVRHMGQIRFTTRRWSGESLEKIHITLKEIYYDGGVRYTSHHDGWRWRVAIVGRPDARSGATSTLCEFWIDQEKDRPMKDRLSARTLEFVDTLQRITGLTYGEPLVMVYDSTTRRTVVRRSHGSTVSEPRVKHQTFDSIEDVPEELREQFVALDEESRKEGVRPVQSVRKKITVRDSAGKERSYNSLEEMPPKVRAYYERIRNKPSK